MKTINKHTIIFLPGQKPNVNFQIWNSCVFFFFNNLQETIRFNPIRRFQYQNYSHD